MKLHPLLLLIIIALAGCFQGNSDSPDQPGGIPMPVGFQSLPAPENLSVKVFMDEEATPRYTSNDIDVDADEITIEFTAPEGEHIFIVIFEYTDLEFPRNDGKPWVVARWSSNPVTVTEGEALSLGVDVYIHDDSDEDGVSNADELIAGTNPGNPDDVPFAVTATAGTGGSISPASQFVRLMSTTAFTVAPDTGYGIDGVTGCDGTLSGNTYTTGEITEACTVTASFIVNRYAITATSDSNGAIDPPSRTVDHGSTTTFTVTPDTGYSASVGGTCGGTLSGNTYTTNAITGDCSVSAAFSLNSYSVNTSAGAGGNIVPPSQTVNHGDTATFELFLAPGYNFNEVQVTGCGDNGKLTLDGARLIYTTGAITDDCTLGVTFALNQYAVTATAGANGSIDPPSRIVEHGDTANFTVTPDTGYSIDDVAGCDGALSGDTYTTGAIIGPCTVTATFSLNVYTVTATAGANGSIDPPSQPVDHGSTTTFTVTPATGYSASVGGTCGGSLSGNTYTTDVITGPCTVSAAFNLNSYTVTATSSPNGSINPASRTVEHGSTTTFTVTPATGYSASVGGTCGGRLSGNTYTTGPVTRNCTVSATFSLNSYTVTATAGPNGTIDPPSRIVEHGDTANFTVTPDTGYSIDSVAGCSGTLDGNTYTTGAITGPCTVSAAFSLNSYTVTATASPGGIIDPASRTVEHGATTTFTVTPATGYSASVGGTCGGSLSGNTYTTDAITGPCTVSATFSLNSYTVTATAGTGGSIDPPSRTVEHGSTTSFTVTPDTGYSIDSVGGCSGTLDGNTYTTGAITGPCTVSAAFSLNSYTVTATAGPNGTIDPASRTVEHGSTTTFTVTPATGYGASMGGTCGGTLDGTSYTTNPITENCTVTANFTLNKYTVTATAGPGGTISPPSRTVDHGQSATFTVNPNFLFGASVGGTCGGTLDGDTYTTEPVTADCTVIATFSLFGIRSLTTSTSLVDPDAFFTDEFSSGTGNWTIVDDVPSSPSSWSTVDGALRQDNNVEGVNSFAGGYHKGTYAYYAAGSDLTDYRFSVDAHSPAASEANDIGIMFRYQDNDNYYRLSMNARYGFTRLEKKVGGVFTPLAVNARGHVPGQPIHFMVEARDNRIQVWIDDEPMLAVYDASLSSGTVALYTQDRADFDNVVVEPPTDTPLITLAAPVSYTAETTDTLTSSAVATQIPDGGKVEFVLDGRRSVIDETAPYSAAFDLVPSGDHTVVVIARDAANNELARDTNRMIGAQGEYLVTLGDRVTNGSGDNFSPDNASRGGRVLASQGYQANLTDLLDTSLQRPVIVYNEGIGGDESVDTAFRRIDSILARHPGSNQALVLLGTNDTLAGTPSGLGCSGTACNGTFKGNMQALVDTLNNAGKSVYVAKAPPVFGLSTPFAKPAAHVTNTRVREYNRVIDNELNGRQVGPDFYDYFLGSANRFSLFADVWHPNALGNAVMAHLWHNALNPGSPVALPLVLDGMTRSASAPYLKQNLLEVGNAYYVDRPYTLTSIPAALASGVWIMTANDDVNGTTADYVSFNVDRPVTVYIAYDGGATARPNWMSAYADTGLVVGSTDPLTPALRVYSRAFGSGSITLGGNLATGASGADSHYTAIVVPD